MLAGSWKANYQADQHARTCVSLPCQVLHARSWVARGRTHQVILCWRTFCCDSNSRSSAVAEMATQCCTSHIVERCWWVSSLNSILQVISAFSECKWLWLSVTVTRCLRTFAWESELSLICVLHCCHNSLLNVLAVFCRYLFALQIKRDLLSGALFCQEHTAVLLASFIVQGI